VIDQLTEKLIGLYEVPKFDSVAPYSILREPFTFESKLLHKHLE